MREPGFEQWWWNFNRHLGNAWDSIWPEHMIAILMLFLLLSLFWQVFKIQRQGFGAWKEGQRNPLQGILKLVAGAVAFVVFLVMILVAVQDFGNEDVTQHHDLWEEQVEGFVPMLKGVVFGEPDSTVVDSVLVATGDSVAVPTVTIPVIAIATADTSTTADTSALDRWKGKLETNWSAWWRSSLSILLRLAFGALVIFHGLWSYKKVNKPMDWNIDPEAENPDPQKNYYGIWGTILFHFFLFLLVSPTTYLLHMVKIYIYWDLLMVLAIVLFVSNRAGMWLTWDELKEKIACKAMLYWARFRELAVEEKELMPEKEGDSSEIVEVATFVGRVKQVLLVTIVLLAMLLVWTILIVKASSMVAVILLLMGSWLLAGCYEVHIRGRLVPMLNKRAIYSRFWLLGKKYLNNGLAATLLAVFIWRLKMFLVDFSVWEINSITTPKIPTKGEDGNPGLPITLEVNPTLQIVDPVIYLGMDESDRANKKVLPDVVERRLLNGLRDACQHFTYEQLKMKDMLQFPVRLQDLDLMSDNHSLRTKYKERAVFWIKVEEGDFYEYVKNDQEGIFRQATFFEYEDWLMMTLMGCSLVEVGVIDATSEAAEEAEERLKISEIEKKIKANLGEAAGKGEAARIKQVATLMKGDDKDMNELAVTVLERLTGADKAGLIFQIVKGLIPETSNSPKD